MHRALAAAESAGIGALVVLNKCDLPEADAALKSLDAVARLGYRVLPLADLPAFLQGREPLPQKTVIITIDDGYESVYRHAYPVLKKYGLPWMYWNLMLKGLD